MRSVLRHPGFRRLFLAQCCSLAGTGLMGVALALVAAELAGARAGVVLGTVFTLKMVAYVGFAPVANAVADRVPTRTLLIGLDLARVALVATLPFATSTLQVYATVFAFYLCSAAFTPAFQSVVPELLPDEDDYARALALSRLAYNLEALASPLLAGLLLVVLAPGELFIGTAVALGASAAWIAAVVFPAQREPDTSAGFGARLAKGFTLYLRTPRLRGYLVASMALALVGGWVLVDSVLLARELPGDPARAFTALLGAYGLGAMASAFAVPRLLRSVAARTLVLAGSFGLGLAPFGLLAPHPGALPVVWALLGAATSFVLTPGGLLLTRSAAAGDRPALFAAQFSLSHAQWLVGYPLAGWLGVALGLRTSLYATAAAALAFAALATYLWPRHDPLEGAAARVTRTGATP